jgi:hypothetical protein
MLADHCTIAFNRATRGGGIAATLSTVELSNNLLARNFSDKEESHDLKGEYLSRGNNLVHHGAGFVLAGGSTGDIVGADPLLDDLRDNGGETQTHALRPGSPAIGAGRSGTIARDQRGVARGKHDSDIGAFEFVPDRQNVDRLRMATSGILNLRREANGEITVTVFSDAGANWVIQATSDLVNWEDVAFLPEVKGKAEFTDTRSTELLRRLYRAFPRQP